MRPSVSDTAARKTSSGTRATFGTHRGILNLRVEQDLSQGAQEQQLFIGRAGDGFAELDQFLFGGAMVFPQALVLQFDGDVDVMLEGLVDEGRQAG